MMDMEGKKEISLKDFQLIMSSTQRVVNFVDEYFSLRISTPASQATVRAVPASQTKWWR